MATADKNMFLTDLVSQMDESVPGKYAKIVTELVKEMFAVYDVVLSLPEDEQADDSLQVLKSYLNTITTEGLAKTTISHYSRILQRLYRDVGVAIRRMTSDHIKDYVSKELARGISKNTIRGYEWIFRKFFRWMHNEGIINTNPMINVSVIKAKPEPRYAFTQEEIQYIKESAQTVQELAMIHFLLATGCRVGELVKVKRSDVDYKNRCLQVTGKGDKTRTVYFDDVTALMLKRSLSKRKDDHPALFYSKRKNYYTENGVKQIMERLTARSKVHVFCHRFRHTFAQTLLDRGMNIQEVSLLLGHENLDTTKKYFHANQKNAENAYRKYACM